MKGRSSSNLTSCRNRACLLCHGEGIWEEDSAEVEAVSVLFGKKRPRALATKGAFGHLLGGSPLVDLLLALRALREDTVPPSPGVGERARDVLDFPDASVQVRNMKHALVLSRGFEAILTPRIPRVNTKVFRPRINANDAVIVYRGDETRPNEPQLFPGHRLTFPFSRFLFLRTRYPLSLRPRSLRRFIPTDTPHLMILKGLKEEIS